MNISELKGLFIVAGHGKSSNGKLDDNGASSGGTNERKEVVEIATELLQILKKDDRFLSIPIYAIGVFERLTLSKKIETVNLIAKRDGLTANNSLLISIHTNAGGGTGLEAFYYGGSEVSNKFAKTLIEGVQKTTGWKYHGTPTKADWLSSYGKLGIIRDTIPNATLLELGFLDNIAECRILRDTNQDDVFAKGIYKGLLNYISLPEIEMNNTDTKGFTDVPNDSWFKDSVNSMSELGILTGYPDRTFKPAQAVNRAELAVALDRLFKKLNS